MKIKEALEIITSGKENKVLFKEIGSIENDIEKSIESIKEWVSRGELGEVSFSGENLDKSVTISIGFQDYWSTVNEWSRGYINYTKDKDEVDEILAEELYFNDIYVSFEEDGNWYHDYYHLRDSDIESGYTYEEFEYIGNTIKEFFLNNE